jgi:hypothetical protein
MLASFSANNDRTDHARARGPRRLHDPREIERDQVGQAQQQAGMLGPGPLGPGVEVDHASPWQLLATRGAAQHLRAAPEPLEPFLGDHLRDPGAIQRDPFPGEHERDLVDRVPCRAQLHDPVVRALLAGCALGSRTR